MKKITLLFFLISFLYSCGGLEIQNHKVERLGLIGIIGFNEAWTVTGTIQNNSNATYRDVTLKIQYQNKNGKVISKELLPLDIIISPNAIERFKIKTNHAPQELEKYLLSIENFNTY